jgi:hypothetical protein
VAGTLAFALLFPLWFFRYARSLWLGFDQFIDPRPGERDAKTAAAHQVADEQRSADGR